MPTVLALDTSTPTTSAATCIDDVVHRVRRDTGRHTGALLPELVRDVMGLARCTPADLQAIAVGLGPGPYTSLRVGVMFALAAGEALGIPVLGACSLDVVARELCAAGTRSEAFVVASDARRREVYWASYDTSGERVSGPQVRSRDEFEREETLRVFERVPDAGTLASWVVEDWNGGECTAAPVTAVWDAPSSDAAQIVVPQTLLQPHPLYLRRPDAAEPPMAGR